MVYRLIRKHSAIFSLVIAAHYFLSSCSSSADDSEHLPSAPKKVGSNWQSVELVVLEEAGGLLSTNVRAIPDKQVPYWIHLFYFIDVERASDQDPQSYKLQHQLWDINQQAMQLIDGDLAETIVTLDNSLPFFADVAADNSLFAAYRGGNRATCNTRQSDSMFSHKPVAAQWQEYLGAIGDSSPRSSVFTDGDAGDYPSFAIDSMGNLHLVFQFFWEGCDSNNLAHPDIRYVNKLLGSYDSFSIFDEEVVEGNDFQSNNQNSVGFFNALILDSNELPMVFYYADFIDSEFGLRVAQRTNSGWQRSWIDKSCRVGAISAALAPDGFPAVAYFIKECAEHRSYTKDDGFGLRYAKFNGVDWDIETVDEATKVGDYVKLAFNQQGSPAIAYYETRSFAQGRTADLFNLKMATFVPQEGLWFKERVAESGDVGKYNSLWFDENGKANIVTYSNSAKAIVWLRQTIVGAEASTK